MRRGLHDVVDLPDLVERPGVRVATRLEGDRVAHVAVISGGSSTAQTVRAIANARRQLGDVPETIGRVEVRLDEASRDRVLAAEAKRRRRAARGW